MSDKFFFKGRQTPRHDHTKRGYTTKASLRGGSEKYPLEITVGSQQRKAELTALAGENDIFANIHVNEECEVEENVAELMALVNKGETTAVPKTPNRNEPCSCGSGKKYKKCCG